MAQEREHAVADEIDGRLVAGDEQQRARAEHLVLGEGVALLLGVHERGEHVVARVGAASGDELAEVLVEREDRLEAALEGFHRLHEVGVEARARSRDQSLKRSWSDGGTPSISQMMTTGSG